MKRDIHASPMVPGGPDPPHLASPALAAPPGKAVEVENIRVGFGETFKVGTWTPVSVQPARGSSRSRGRWRWSSDDESGTPTVFAQSVRVGTGESTRIVAYTRPGSPSGALAVRFVKDGKRVAATDLDTISPNKAPTRLFSDEIAILVPGEAAGGRAHPGPAGVQRGAEPVGRVDRLGQRRRGRPAPGARRQPPARPGVRVRRL